ncbi:MAG: PAS domain-containing protein, partial [Rectinema sp.]|nr:PAS domain-containing protein [Rectinema sp.]
MNHYRLLYHPAKCVILSTNVNKGPNIPSIFPISYEKGESVRFPFFEKNPQHPHRQLIDTDSVLRSLFENAHHFGIFRLRIEPANPGKVSVVLASPSVSEMIGIEDLSDFAKWFDHVHPDDLERLREANHRTLEQGSSYNQIARIYNPKEGRWRWIQVITSSGFDLRGRLSHLDGMLIDLTEQKEAERALQELNITLERRVRDRTEEIEHRRQAAESLRDILHMINSNMPLEEFLQKAAELAARQLGAGACVIHHLDLEKEVITQLAGYGLEGIFENRARRPFSALPHSGGGDYLKALLRKKPIFGNYGPLPDRIDCIRNDPTIPDAIKSERIALRARFAASFAAPLYIQERLYGGIVFYYTDPQEFDEEQVQLGLTFAGQFALAIENAILREQAAEAAVLSERNRIARDLHDAVSQTLFSASLVAEVLPRLWQKNP